MRESPLSRLLDKAIAIRKEAKALHIKNGTMNQRPSTQPVGQMLDPEPRTDGLQRYWVGWKSGNYASEGCTKAPFKIWITGQSDRDNWGLTPEKLAEYKALETEAAADEFLDKYSKDDCSMCAVIDAESVAEVEGLIAKHFPDYEMRFCDPKPSNYDPGNRFPK